MPAPTLEITLLGWSVVLFFAHMMIQASAALRDTGAAYNAGPRDAGKSLGVLAGRAQRTFDNFKETYPLFIALTLALAVTGRAGGLADTGAWLWFGARIVYIPLYLAGVPWLRSLCWGVGTVGLVLMLVRLL
ncbi:MAG TPA: MAPEG family protein [Caulobacteraceae bacterium]|jgi:uncharacterized MAPEG superfamily protein